MDDLRTEAAEAITQALCAAWPVEIGSDLVFAEQVGRIAADALLAALEEALRERDEARAKLDKPCGECHPCTNWPAETWRRAGRFLPDVHRFGEMQDERRAMRPVVEAAKAWRHTHVPRWQVTDDDEAALVRAVDTYETQEGTDG